MLVRDIPNRLVVLWDGSTMHKGDPIRDAVENFAPRLTLERLPPYAPMLNLVEPLWSWLKYSRLCNFAPADACELNERTVSELNAIAGDQDFLKLLWHASDLPLPRACFSDEL
jgi:hypothetical protein